MNHLELLKAYLSVWNNRSINIDEESAERDLLELLTRELNDEYTHPRLRKSKEAKFYLAIKRLSDSDINKSDKLELIQLYIQLMEEE